MKKQNTPLAPKQLSLENVKQTPQQKLAAYEQRKHKSQSNRSSAGKRKDEILSALVTPQTPCQEQAEFGDFVDNCPSESQISQESAPTLVENCKNYCNK